MTSALALAGSLTSAGGGGRERETVAQSFTERLHASGASNANPAVLGRSLAQLGPEVVPSLFAALAAGNGTDGADATKDAQRPTLSGSQREACLECARRLGSGAVADFVEERAPSVASVGERAALLELAGVSGRPRLLTVASQLAYRVGEGSSLDPLLRRRFEATATALFQRNPAALQQLSTLLGDHPAPVGRSLLLAASEVPGRAVLQGLERVLEGGRQHRVFLLSVVGKCAGKCSRPYPEGVRTWVRELLDSNDPQVLREAALACGRLGDEESVGALIRLLDHPRPPVRETALYSLQLITDEKLQGDVETWRQWFKGQRDWELDERPGVLSDLDSPRTAKVLKALNELSKRRLGRENLSAQIAPLVRHPSEQVRIRTCETLRVLGACRDMEPLTEALDDASLQVRAAAWSALRSLTGWQLAADSDVWQRSLEAGTPVLEEEGGRPDAGRSSERRSAAFFRL